MNRDNNWRDKLGTLIGVTWTTYTLAYLFNVFFYFNVIIYSTTHRAINVGLITSLVYLIYPLKGNKTLTTFIDSLAILIIWFSCGYIAYFGDKLIFSWGDASPIQMVLGSCLIACLLEATRRTVNVILPIIILTFFFYTVYSDYFPGFWRVPAFRIQGQLDGCI